MSSEQPIGLCNLDYAPRYEEILERNLPPSFAVFGEFFAGTQRLHTLGAMLESHVAGDGKQVLNIGSGAFATEIFVAALQGQTITAVDYTPEFAPFYDLFRREGHLQTTQFQQADAMEIEFEPESLDLIILHDVLYEPALDLEALVDRLRPFLKPGGLLFLDFVNSRTLWIWKLLGRPNQFRRYDPRRVRAFLEGTGFEIVDWRRPQRSSSRLVRLFHALLWHILRASNNYAVLARKTATDR